MARVLKGVCFLSNLTLKEVEELYKKEKNAKAKSRLQAVILRKKNKTLEEISSVVGYPLTTVGDWLRRVHNGGIQRVYSIKQMGKPSRLNKEQKKFLSEILEQPPSKVGLPYKIWTTKILAHYIVQQYGIHYKIRRIEGIVHELGFNFKKARPEHRKANKMLQDDFKKNFIIQSNPTLIVDGRSYSLTKASFK
jgi:transposase